MNLCAEYRVRALRCEHLAEKAHSESRKQHLLDVAMKLERLAEDVEDQASALDRQLPTPTD